MFSRGIVCALLAIVTSTSAYGLTVPATGNLWLAGMPEGTTSSGGWDYAPIHSPAQVTEIAIVGGRTYMFAVTGAVAHGTDSFSSHLYGGDGGPDVNGGSDYIVSHDAGAENGIGNISTPYNSLLGVFLDDSVPKGQVAPSYLDFGAPGFREFVNLSPLLRQPFFIGDGKTTAQTVQQFTAPVGATRLFLGMMDRYGWSDNVGSFTVTVTQTPEPTSVALLGVPMAAMLMRRRRK
jgi:hypothetical protein